MVIMHSSVLYMLGKNMRMAWFNAIHIALFAGSAALLVPHMGFVGYGWAEIVAMPGYVIIHLFLASAVGSPSYAAPAIWYATTAGIIVLGAVGVPALYFGFAALFTPLFFRRESDLGRVRTGRVFGVGRMSTAGPLATIG